MPILMEYLKYPPDEEKKLNEKNTRQVMPTGTNCQSTILSVYRSLIIINHNEVAVVDALS